MKTARVGNRCWRTRVVHLQIVTFMKEAREEQDSMNIPLKSLLKSTTARETTMSIPCWTEFFSTNPLGLATFCSAAIHVIIGLWWLHQKFSFFSVWSIFILFGYKFKPLIIVMSCNHNHQDILMEHARLAAHVPSSPTTTPTLSSLHELDPDWSNRPMQQRQLRTQEQKQILNHVITLVLDLVDEDDFLDFPEDRTDP